MIFSDNDDERMYIMMVGVPASGKSTIRNKLVDKIKLYDYDVLSSDDYIEYYADLECITYDVAFKKYISYVEKQVQEEFKKFCLNSQIIIDDRTNLTVKSRRKKLNTLKQYQSSTFKKIAIHVQTPPEEELYIRLNSRPGKTIPIDVMKSMMLSAFPPSYDEGFDDIYVVAGGIFYHKNRLTGDLSRVILGS